MKEDTAQVIIIILLSMILFLVILLILAALYAYKWVLYYIDIFEGYMDNINQLKGLIRDFEFGRI